MEFRPYRESDSSAVELLFTTVFTKSEGEAEGALIGNLSRALMSDTADADLYGFVAVDRAKIVGSIFFSRLTFEYAVEAFILSPVAIHSDHQGRGIGQGLINHGLRESKDRGIRLIMTYGDPRFYGKVGFVPVAQDAITAPFELSQPEGWLGQALTGNLEEITPSVCSCVKALSTPTYW